MNLLKDIR